MTVQCPSCSDVLVEDGAGQQRCAKCHGTWVTEATLVDVLRGAAGRDVGLDAIETHELPAQVADKHQRACPTCGVQMTPGMLFDVLVDRCESAHGVWTDAGELSRIVLAARRMSRRTLPG